VREKGERFIKGPFACVLALSSRHRPDATGIFCG
jgi:hypothetical protein